VKFKESFFIRDALIVTPGATAFILTPWNEVSRAVVFTNILSIAIEVEKMMEPGWGVSPALLDKTVIVPLCNFKKGTANDEI
jgi:hypothetical protein